jgi:hypothetical protein
LILAFKSTTQNKVLLVLDIAAFYKTLAILQKLYNNFIILVLVLPGCTRLLQLLDIVVNKLFKELLQEYTE